ncbi:unnamed protein product [Amoebophrya sp. A25]|nr:unnamed protein product [Amoebophrya sp. A25]|eukprot:GSA25T00015589001.1
MGTDRVVQCQFDRKLTELKKCPVLYQMPYGPRQLPVSLLADSTTEPSRLRFFLGVPRCRKRTPELPGVRFRRRASNEEATTAKRRGAGYGAYTHSGFPAGAFSFNSLSSSMHPGSDSAAAPRVSIPHACNNPSPVSPPSVSGKRHQKFVNGGAWYEQQAMRPINEALGTRTITGLCSCLIVVGWALTASM